MNAMPRIILAEPEGSGTAATFVNERGILVVGSVEVKSGRTPDVLGVPGPSSQNAPPPQV